MCVVTGMTREQALNESPAWLELLEEAHDRISKLNHLIANDSMVNAATIPYSKDSSAINRNREFRNAMLSGIRRRNKR